MDESKLTWEKATDLTATSTTIYYTQTEIPASIKREACQSFLLMERAKELRSGYGQRRDDEYSHAIRKETPRAFQCN